MSEGFTSIPIGSLTVLVPVEEQELYVNSAMQAPGNLRDLIFAERTGAYVRGLVRTYNLDRALTPQLAFTVLRVATGMIRLNQLIGELAQRLSIDQNAAEKLALEIERDLFAPVALELNQYVKAIGQQTVSAQAPTTVPSTPSRRPEMKGMKNVLDLKDRPKPPSVPPPMPRRPREA